MTNTAYFWQKPAYLPKDRNQDTLRCFQIEINSDIREVIRGLEEKHIGKRIPLPEATPKNPSVINWITKIMDSFPDRKDEFVDFLLDAFRAELSTRSREQEKGVGALLLNDTLFVGLFSKDLLLAQIGDNAAKTVKALLTQKNIYRAVIIKSEEKSRVLSAYEYNKKLTQGLADFLGISVEDISWESTGTIILQIKLENCDLPIQLPIETDGLKKLFDKNELSPNGRILLGQATGQVTSAQIFGKTLDFPEFYDYYHTKTQKLDIHRKKFNDLIESQNLMRYDIEKKNTFMYEDDIDKLVEFSVEGKKEIMNKAHPRFRIIYFTKDYPGIKPNSKLLWDINQAIFKDVPLDLWHAGELSDDNFTALGNLKIFNRTGLSDETIALSNNLLNVIRDSESQKFSALMKYYYCELMKFLFGGKQLRFVFEFIQDTYLSPDLITVFGTDGLCAKEGALQFKSSADVDPKPTKFAKDTLVPTIKNYNTNGKLRACCILYGIEDNSVVRPIHHLKNDGVTTIESIANSELLRDNISVKLCLIPYKDAFVLLVFIIPIDAVSQLSRLVSVSAF